VNAVALSADGKRLYTGAGRGATQYYSYVYSQDNGERVWDVETGKRLTYRPGKARFNADEFVLSFKPDLAQGHGAAILAATFSADGNTLFSGGSDREFSAWDSRSGEELRSFGNEQGKIEAVALDAPGESIAVAYASGSDAGNVVRLLDVKTGSERLRLDGPAAEWDAVTRALAFSPDGSQLLLAGQYGISKVTLASSTTGESSQAVNAERIHLADWQAGAMDVTFSADGLTGIAALSSGRLVTWLIANPLDQRRWLAHSEAALALASLPDGRRLVSGGADGRVIVWDLQTAAPLAELVGHAADVPIMNLDITPDGMWLASAGHDRQACVWRLADLDSAGERRATGAPEVIAGSVPVTDTLQALETQPISLRAARLTLGERIDRYIEPKRAVPRALAIGNVGATAIVATGRAWDPFVWLHPSEDWDVIGWPRITRPNDVSISLWDLSTSLPPVNLKTASSLHSDSIDALALSEDGTKLFSGGMDGQLIATDRASGDLLWSADALLWQVRKLLPLGDRLIVGSRWNTPPDGQVAALDASSGELLWAAQLSTAVVGLATAGDDSIVAAFADGRLVRIALADGSVIDSTELLRDVTAMRAGPEPDSFLIGSEDGRLSLVDYGGTERWTSTGHAGPIVAIAISSDGQRILTGSEDRTAALWSADTGAQILRLVGHGDDVVDVAFLPDEAGAVTISLDGTTRIWDLTEIQGPGE
jgi:WD40 repeat protein